MNVFECSALKGLYPDIDAANGGLTEKNDKCIITECNVSSCGAGYKYVTRDFDDFQI